MQSRMRIVLKKGILRLSNGIENIVRESVLDLSTCALLVMNVLKDVFVVERVIGNSLSLNDVSCGKLDC